MPGSTRTASTACLWLRPPAGSGRRAANLGLTSRVHGMTSPGADASNSWIARDGAFRLLVDVAGFVLGGAGAVITTRSLGPAGQGTFAVISLTAGLVILAASCGLGEAAVVR